MQYVAKVSRDRGRTLVDFPDCPGCQTFARKGEDVVAVAREALEGWLELHLEDGAAPPRPAAKIRGSARSSLLVRIDPSLAIRLAIRWGRQDRQLSQGDLAKLVGVSRQQISLLETEGSNLTIGTLKKVARALGSEVSVDFVSPSAA